MKKWISVCCIALFLGSVFSISSSAIADEKDNWMEQSQIPVLEKYSASWCVPCLMMDEVIVRLYDSGTPPFQFLTFDVMNKNSFIQDRRIQYEVQGIPHCVLQGTEHWIGFSDSICESISETIENFSFTKKIELSAKEEHTEKDFTITARYDLLENAEGTLNFALVSHLVMQDGVHFRNYVVDGQTFTIDGTGEKTVTFELQNQADTALLKALVWVEVEGEFVGNVWLEYCADPFDNEKGFLSFPPIIDLETIQRDKETKRYVRMENIGLQDAHFTLSSDSTFLRFSKDYTVKANRKKGIPMYIDTTELEPGKNTATITIHPLEHSISPHCNRTFQIRFSYEPQEE
jgi:thiol-disulfide isomerase/thioredoxin